MAGSWPPSQAALTLTVFWTLILSSKHFLFRNSQICHTVPFTCMENFGLGCRVLAIQPSSSLAVTVLSPFMNATGSTSMLTGIAPFALF